MKANLFHGPGDIRYEDCDLPDLAKGEILVKVEAALTGGTDVKTYLNGHPRIIKSIPSAFGYEFAGTIEAIGGDVNGFQKGMRVVAANTAPCYECYFCEREEFSLCENLDFLNGSFAEYIKIPAAIVKHNLYEIPQNLDFKSAACVQTLAVALHGFARSNCKSKDTIAIYGLGPIGQSFIKIANACKQGLLKDYFKSSTDLKIIALGRSEHKRKLAKENGADIVIDCSRDFEAEFKQASPYGADIVIEAVGKAEAWQACQKLVRRGGLINFFGGCPKGSTVELDTFKLHYDEVKTIGVFHHSPKYIQMALEILSKELIKMDDLISHEMKLSELENALKLMLDAQATKVLISP